MSKLFIISSVAGGGKTTLINGLLKKYTHFYFSVSYTTRKKRENEIHGIHYFFINEKDFEEKIKKQEFIEWALVHDHYYGTPIFPIQNSISNGNPVILDIDVQGATMIKKKLTSSTSIFIEPPSEEIWLERLKERNTDSLEQIKLRIENGKKELLKKKLFDYQVLNHNLETALYDLEQIILKELKI